MQPPEENADENTPGASLDAASDAASARAAQDSAAEDSAAEGAEVTRLVETRVVEARTVHTRVVEQAGEHVSASESVESTVESTLLHHEDFEDSNGVPERPEVTREVSIETHGASLEGRLDEAGRLEIESLQREPATLDSTLERDADPTATPASVPSDVAQVLAGAAEAPAPQAPEVLGDAHAAHVMAGDDPAPDDLLLRVRDLEIALSHRERQIRAMQQTAEALLSHATVDAMVRTTLELAIGVLEAEAGSLLLHNEVTDTLVFRYVIGPAAETLIGHTMPSSKGIAGGVFKSGVPAITQKVAESSEHNRDVDAKTGFRTESMLTVPLKRGEGDSLGVMQILNSSAPFDGRDLEVVQVMAAQASASIENARLVQEARKAEIVNVIGDISHDIKNMLTPIQSGVWTLEPMLDEHFRALDAIVAGSSDLPLKASIMMAADMVRDDYGWILAAALDAAEKVQVRTKEIADAVKGESAPPLFVEGQLNEVASEVTRSLRLVALDARLDLEEEFDPALPLAEFDRKQIYNALYNLVNNAIPETPEGGAITIRTIAPSEDDPNTLTIEVADTGKGMPPHVKARLFTDEAVSTKPGGTGLGTRIVAGVVKRHHGKISVDSEPGQGTTFTIKLPLRHEVF